MKKIRRIVSPLIAGIAVLFACSLLTRCGGSPRPETRQVEPAASAASDEETDSRGAYFPFGQRQPDPTATSGTLSNFVESIRSFPRVTYVDNTDPWLRSKLSFSVTPKRKNMEEEIRKLRQREATPQMAPPGPTPGGDGSGPSVRAFSTTFDSWALSDTGAIPPDPHNAVGMNHVVNVVNVAWAEWTKSGGLGVNEGLATFFGALVTSGATLTDPRVMYDQFADRFVMTLLEIGPGSNSQILFAVSATGDPGGLWHKTELDSNIAFSAPAEGSFNDYPAIGLDDQAVYITTHQFGQTSGLFREARIFAVDKGLGAGGIYDGGAASFNVIDPPDFMSDPTVNFGISPAHMFGTHPTGAAYISLYNGFNNGVDQFLRVYTLTDPLGSPTIVAEFVNFGNVDDLSLPVPDAPQQSGAQAIDVFSRIVMSNSVWRDDNLYLTTVIRPPSGPDAGQATAHWIQIGAAATLDSSASDGGNIGAEDVASNTHTFYPSVAVDDLGNVGFGFAMSGTNIHPGAGFAFRTPIDPSGTVQPTEILASGVASYQNLGDGLNRWGDYSGIALDPDTGCFWVYNQYSDALNSWGTRNGENCVASTCGNMVVEPGETCDPPGQPAGDPNECRADCTFCGDTILSGGAEECDDGNNIDGDGCSATCILEVCGNSLLQTAAGESCDPPGLPPGQPDVCRGDCTFCGDGTVDADRELIQNGDFEAGSFLGWTVDVITQGSFYIDVPGTPTPESGTPTTTNAGGGNFYAVSDEPGPATHALSQAFQVPADATQVLLNFEMFVNNWNTEAAGAPGPDFGTFIDAAGLDDTTANPNQHGRVDLLNTGFGPFDTSAGAIVRNFYIGADTPLPPPENPYLSYNFDITNDVVPGQTYILRFANTGNQFFLNLGVDNVSIALQPTETCDDGNNLPNDTCASHCVVCTTAPFLQTIRAQGKNLFIWDSPADVRWVRGDLANVATYGTVADGSSDFATQLDVPQNPASSGDGLYWIFRSNCPGASWRSGGVGECNPPSLCVPGGRDGGALP